MFASLPRRVLALVTLASFVSGSLPRAAFASGDRQSAGRIEEEDTPPASESLPPPKSAAPAAKAAAPATKTEVKARSEESRSQELSRAARDTLPAVVTPDSLPTGADKTGASSQAISVPQGAGKVEGMGESFSMQLSTGVATFSVPFALPAARGGASPSLALSYSTSGGHGLAGVGWNVGVPFIARQTDRGLPAYADPAPGQGWSPTQDRFVFNGGQELVPICLVTGGACAGALAQEQMPAWANGWQYFRSRVEESFLRFFWSPDHRTWRIQSKTGENLELGAPLDASDATGTLETDPDAPSRLFRWNLSRQYDSNGDVIGAVTPHPVNLVVYRYVVDAGSSYLTDIYDTPPAANAATAEVASYAHHVRLLWEPRTDTTTSYRRGWPVRQALRLHGVDVASKPFLDTSSARKLLRRYHLTYDASYHVSLLTTVQVEGRCGTAADGEAGERVLEDDSAGLPAVTNCPTLPPMTFEYTHVAPYHTDGSPASADLPGYEGFDERVISMDASPPNSIDEEMTDLFDVNSDGLPDVLVTTPGLYGAKQGVFFNGGEGRANGFSQDTIGIQGVLGEDASVLSLRNPNISIGDLDGDGIVDLVHMPQVKTYSVYAPQRIGAQWWWVGRLIDTAAAQSPKINLGNDGVNIQRVDVNGDGLVDVALTTGTEVETFFALGKYPGGDGQFGHAQWTGPTTATISNDPVTACVPWSGTPLRFSDAGIKLGDMNGDGLADIVKLSPGSVQYWPGRGNGFWGTGRLDDCTGGTFGSGRDIAMDSAPQYSDPNGSTLRLDDVNGDGLDDLVQVRFQEVDVWLNIDGASWTDRHVVANAPASPSFANRARLVDVNGSGTRDVLWGDGSAYRYMDLAGGAQPWLLARMANGVGKTTDLEYSTSTTQMLAAVKANQPWATTAPIAIPVVSTVTDSDNLEAIGRPAGKYVTTYTYRDPLYDGRQREFRGFRTVRATRLGDANSPTSATDSTFLLGQCQDEETPHALPSPCTSGGRWRDNPREALKGLVLLGETFDASARYLSTAHQTYRLRHLYAGLDGREVRHAFASQTDTWLYDTAAFHPASAVTSLAEVELEAQPPPLDWRWDVHDPSQPAQTLTSVTLRSTPVGRAHLHTTSQFDGIGNAVLTHDDGCVEGCTPTDSRIAHWTFPGRVPGDLSGWNWRNQEEYTLGYGAYNESEPRHHLFYSFDTRGNTLSTSRQIIGTLPLDRFREGSRAGETHSTAVASAPPGASGNSTVVLVSYTPHDDFGSATGEQGSNQRCSSVDYDSAYHQFVTTETVLVGPALGGGACGTTPLITSALYDRGVGAPTIVSGVHLGSATTAPMTIAAYDGFGRLVTLTKPDPLLGAPSSRPSLAVEYILPANAQSQPFSIVHTRSQDAATSTEDSYHESWAYGDGLGRTIVTLDQADPAQGDGGQWIANGLTSYDAKGATERAYLSWFYSGDPAHFPLAIAPASPYSRQRHDAFGRSIEAFGLDGSQSMRHAYHALSVDAWDAGDLAPGPHQNTYASETKDGHGRVIVATERVHVGGTIEVHETHTQAMSTGEPVVISRVRVGRSDPPVVRWMRYDTAGQMVLNVEPDASLGFTPTPTLQENQDPPANLKAWRYAYDDAGDLVGTSDPRGCGVNYHYESGRLLGEDYSPCLNSQPDYTPADPGARTGFEVLNGYDTADPETTKGIAGECADTGWLAGHLVSVTDRASNSVTRNDARGRPTCIARRLAGARGELAPRWYVQTVSFDAADRPITERTSSCDAPSAGRSAVLDVTSSVTTTYAKRGAVARVDSDHGPLVDRVTHSADGHPLEIAYADVAKTTTTMTYDTRRRLASVQTYRGSPNALWRAPSGAYTPAPNPDGPPSTFQLLLEDLDYTYDAVDNPVEIRDWRVASEWPAGAKPVSRKMQYDDLYRVTRIDYAQTNGVDSWVDPFEAEDAGDLNDLRRAHPSPHVSFTSRTQSQVFSYDWLGNTITTSDDARGFYDRSLGAITNGTVSAGPYQIRSATGESGVAGAPSRGGTLTVAYDAAGNMTSMALNRDGPCLPTGATCSQRFIYDWDEVGRLTRARRWDLATAGNASDDVPQDGLAADLRYAYDASDHRAIKVATDRQGHSRVTLYPFDALELRGTTWSDTNGDYQRTAETQVPYLFAHGARLGRVAYAEEDVPTLTSGAGHVFLELADHLGSTALVLDRDTSELVESSTYQGYGGTESDYRPGRWKGFREDYRFTGKEEDVEVGLQYFGKRYFAPGLGRWVSADPLTIHGLGADHNAYAYVHGTVFRAIDAIGLDGSGTFNATREGAGAGATLIPGGAPPVAAAQQGVSTYETNNAQNRWAQKETVKGIKEGVSDWMFDSLTARTVESIKVAAGGRPFARYPASEDSALSASVRSATPVVIDTTISMVAGAAIGSGMMKLKAPVLELPPIEPIEPVEAPAAPLEPDRALQIKTQLAATDPENMSLVRTLQSDGAVGLATNGRTTVVATNNSRVYSLLVKSIGNQSVVLQAGEVLGSPPMRSAAAPGLPATRGFVHAEAQAHLELREIFGGQTTAVTSHGYACELCGRYFAQEGIPHLNLNPALLYGEVAGAEH